MPKRRLTRSVVAAATIGAGCLALAAFALGTSGRTTNATSRDRAASIRFLRAAGELLRSGARSGPSVDRKLAALTAEVASRCPLVVAHRVKARPIAPTAETAVLAAARAYVLVGVAQALRRPVRAFVREVGSLGWTNGNATRVVHAIVLADTKLNALRPRDLCADVRAAVASDRGALPSEAQQFVADVAGGLPDSSLVGVSRLLPGIADIRRKEIKELDRLDAALQATLSSRLDRWISRLDARLGMPGAGAGGLRGVPATPARRW
jgi:hypothetical protein